MEEYKTPDQEKKIQLTILKKVLDTEGETVPELIPHTAPDISPHLEENTRGGLEAPEPEPETVTILVSQLTYLIDTIKNYEASEDIMASVMHRAMDAFGLINKKTGEPVDQLKNGEGVMGCIIDAIKENISITDMMFNKKKSEKDMEKKFGFFSEIVPIFENYARRKKQR